MSICHFQLNEGLQMGYLKEFQTRIANHDYPGFLRLWEEYCSSDDLDPEELKLVLRMTKNSDLAENFGRHVERVLPLWKKMSDSPATHEVIKLIVDLETTNHESLAQLTYEYLKDRYGSY